MLEIIGARLIAAMMNRYAFAVAEQDHVSLLAHNGI
jgi:hypothetical protein